MQTQLRVPEQGSRRVNVAAPAGSRPLEAMIEAEPFWSSFGRVRRRPPVYAAASIVMAATAWSTDTTDALWIAVALAMMTAAAVMRRPAPETIVTYAGDVAALAAGVVFIGLEPTSALSLWSAIAVVGFFGLARAQAYLLFGLAMGAIAGTFAAGTDLALVDLSDSRRFAVSAALTLIGFAYLGTVVPSLADATRTVLRSADAAAESQRRQAEFRAQLASTVAHELRNPLAGIRGFVDVLVETGEQLPAEERFEYLSIVASQAASLEGIVEDLLVAVQEENDRMTVDERIFDAGELVGKVVTELGPGAAEQVTVEARTGLLAIGDPPRVAQIVRNLLSNARKYGGSNVLVSCEAGDGWLRIIVVDDGPGIAPSEVARVFERFEGTARGSGGYGLGLPISRQLAQAMGGDLTYEHGTGATFVLTLPTP
ncbi:MAG TPA: HAMP domain-containing sensor histidine kinase [Acidimicrobiia bacterium]|nr:HAMP domain-containing sensor histidine kinase [Acidimicrobiia bacterium]